MRHRGPPGLRWRASAVLLVAALASGCVLPRSGDRTGRAISVDPAELRRGRATKESLLDRLGPPLAIAEPGEEVEELTPGEQRCQAFDCWTDDGSRAIRQADAWFALFAERVAIRPGHRVYHWSTTTRPGVLVWLVFLVIQSHWATTEDLWVLVDEETGLVVAAVRRETG